MSSPLCRPHLSPPRGYISTRRSTLSHSPLLRPSNSLKYFANRLRCTKSPLFPPHLPKEKPTIFREPRDVEEPFLSKNRLLEVPAKLSSSGESRRALLCAVSIGFALALMGLEESSKALALGPEGPLVEEFWDNVRRYGLYALTVSTGAIYTILQPIVELLKNPISAILLILIIGDLVTFHTRYLVPWLVSPIFLMTTPTD